jgi:hypothetical protein
MKRLFILVALTVCAAGYGGGLILGTYTGDSDNVTVVDQKVEISHTSFNLGEHVSVK